MKRFIVKDMYPNTAGAYVLFEEARAIELERNELKKRLAWHETAQVTCSCGN
jgi:hypothetical protein